jgi:hypothetical protein
MDGPSLAVRRWRSEVRICARGSIIFGVQSYVNRAATTQSLARY